MFLKALRRLHEVVFRDLHGPSHFGSISLFFDHFLDPSLDPLFLQNDAPRVPKGTPKPSKMGSKSVSGRGSKVGLDF